MNILRTFRHHRRAVAAVEFGLAVPFLALALAATTDFGFAQWRRSALTNAIAQGAYYAFRVGPTVTAANVKATVQNGATFSGVTATVTSPACYCPNAATTPASLQATTCASTCSDGATVGTYITITANYTLSSFFPAVSAYDIIGNDLVSDQVTVRLQ